MSKSVVGNGMRIGWIGLGAMGLGMARCAARAGHQLVGHTRGRLEHQALVTDGGALSGDLDAVVDGAEVVCVNVFSAAQVRSLLYDDGVLAKLAPGTVLVLHTTSDPVLARQLAAGAPRMVEVVDAAFSGSPEQAAAGALTMMVGGSPNVVTRLRPLLDTYAAFIRHVGATGTGMQLKLLNNLLFAAQVRLAAETYRIAATEGFAMETVTDVLSRCSGASRALGIVGRDGRVARNLDGMRVYIEKDVAAAIDSAHAAGIDLGILGEVARGFGHDLVERI
ncbi:MAG: NAD(P)-dependent oxidoreductase [Rhodospirillaceae bacterium]|nr:MAG: NAD(P)-dependent oxidoreductase [Rhodospirillaceae bacterium]